MDHAMHPALIKLLKLRVRGGVRRMFRGLKTPRGALFFGAAVVVFGLMLGPSIVYGAMGRRDDPETVRTFAPLVMLGFCMMTVVSTGGQRGVTFSPAEVDFLFPGPFTRRQILGYRLSLIVVGVAVTALFLSVVFLRHASWWLAAYLGLFVALVFIQFFSTAVILLGQTIGERSYTRGRRIVLGLVAALVAVGIVQALDANVNLAPRELVGAFRASWAGYVLLPIFDVFALAITAERLFPDLVQWLSVAAAIDFVMLAGVMKLDANYLEAALATSRERYERVQRMRSGGVAATWRLSASARWRVPGPRWMGGAGPIAWRQLTGVVRSGGAMMMLLIVIGALALPLWLLSRQGVSVVGPMVGMAVAATFYMSMLVPFDFRRDLDHMDWLKSLPLRPAAVALGEIVTPVSALLALQGLLLAAVGFLTPGSWPIIGATVAFLIPFNFLMIAVENLIFLYYPTRLVAPNPGDMQFIGRQMLVMFAKFLLLTLCCGAAAGLGGLAYWLAGGSWLAFGVISWLALCAFSAALVPAVASAFRRFDPSMDTPA